MVQQGQRTGPTPEWWEELKPPPELRPDVVTTTTTTTSRGTGDAARSAQDAAKALADYVAQLQFERDQLTRTSQEQDIYNALKHAGVQADSAAGQQTIQLVTQTDDLKQAQADLNAELAQEAAEHAEAQQVIESLKSPFDKYLDQLSRLNKLLADGQLSQDQFNLAAQKAAGTLQQQQTEMDKLGDAAQQVGDDLSSAFVDAIASGKSLSEVLQALVRDILNIVAKIGTSSLSDLLGGLGKELLAGIFGPSNSIPGNQQDLGQLIDLSNAQGNVFFGGNVIPFRRGGVVMRPTIFAMATGAGLMGEAGPEAVMPLTRGPDGNLGVRATAGPGGASVEVVINNYSGQSASATQRSGPDGRQIIEVTVGKAVTSDLAGHGPISRALETTYGLGRRGIGR
jgi:phage-related minor tail protein